ncbi:thioesterase II family protein [Actinokineospora guangxiensis]|uniref:Thioesterase II family protein n=1 Tax=Actinokineospora guangxiensis TaxID=1490288 RepID=A0ABW0ET89_9PSEU
MKPPLTRLLCLPPAGAAARAFLRWDLPDWVEIVPVELPGRGSRFAEPPRAVLHELLDAVRPAFRAAAADGPYAVFGHSLGALVGYELAVDMQDEGIPPLCLLPAGAGAPHLPARSRTGSMDDATLRAHLARLGGTPPEVLASDEMMRLLLPVLRADLRVAESYEPRTGTPLSCPITVFAGADDLEAPVEDATAWARYAPAGFAAHVLPGGHFFPDTDRETLLSRVAAALVSAHATTSRRDPVERTARP